MLLRMGLCGFLRVVRRIQMMAMSNVGVMSCRFVITLFVMLSGFSMMLRSLIMMFGSLLMMFRGLLFVMVDPLLLMGSGLLLMRSGFRFMFLIVMFRHTFCSPFEVRVRFCGGKAPQQELYPSSPVGPPFQTKAPAQT
jgi:hypothetical protein